MMFQSSKTLLCLAVLSFVAGSSSAETTTVHRAELLSISSQRGSHSDQDFSVLNTVDQTGSQNDWDTYVEFTGQGNRQRYKGTFQYQVPADMNLDDVTTLSLNINYLGDAMASTKWDWLIRNWNTRRWETIGDNRGVSSWTWSALQLHIDDIDLFDATQQTIDQLHNDGRIVICYFSAGSLEDWRPDRDDFDVSLMGNPLDPQWPGEWWLDISQIDDDTSALARIMRARLDLAVSKNCDGVEPDNIDGYTNDNGLGLTAEHQRVYNTWLAAEAHRRSLSIGLKNDLDQVSELVSHFDWALNEQCWQYNECDRLDPFVNAGKAVFGVEYVEERDNGSNKPEVYCPVLNAKRFSWLEMTYDLDSTVVTDCRDI